MEPRSLYLKLKLKYKRGQTIVVHQFGTTADSDSYSMSWR